jgi:TonB family protein
MSILFVLDVNQKRHWQSFAIALGLEIALGLTLVMWMFRDVSTHQNYATPLSIDVLMDTPFEKQAVVERQKKPSQLELPKTKVLPMPKQETATSLAQQPTPAESHNVQPLSKETTTPMPSLGAPSALPAVDPALAYNIKLAAAVQAAFEVPGTAKALGFKGKARIEFSMRNGVASSIRVIQSSGLSAVDRAAITAVQVASFPQPPITLQNKDGTYQIWVACF